MITFFTFLDDIAVLADDTAAMTKAATKKTASILIDDLAVNAEKGAGFSPSRELPVLWAIIKGAIKNKLILLPIIFLLAFTIPSLITIILVIGALYLAFEGAEKVLEWIYAHEEHVLSENKGITEESKIKSAILTDFILSVEIIVLALSTVANKPLMQQAVVVTAIAFLAVIAVYGFVAFLIRLDDMGAWLITKGISSGKYLIYLLPWIIKSLSIIGTLAMLLVAGGILTHKIDLLHSFDEAWYYQMIIAFVVGVVVFLIHMKIKNLFKNHA